MNPPFNPAEALQLARRIEANGAAFYRAAAERAERPETRQLFLDLAAMEEEHERTFAKLHAEWTKGVSAEDVFDPDHDAVKFLRAFADGTVFDVHEETGPPLTGRESMVEILRAAIGKEKDSVVFYLGLEEGARNPEDAARFDAIVREEMKHIVLLADALKAVSA